MFKYFFTSLLLVVISLNTVAEPMTVVELQQSLKQLAQGKKDTAEVELLLRLAHHYIYKAGEEKKDMDSAALFIQKAEILSKTLKYTKGLAGTCLQQAILAREKQEREKGRKLCDSAILLCTRYKLPYLLGEAYIECTQYYGWFQNDERALKTQNYEKAITAFKQSGSVEREAFCLKNLADLNQASKNHPLAIRQARQALQLYQSINYKKLQGVYDLLNHSYSAISDYASATKYGLLAVEAAENVRDTSMQLCTIYNRLGITVYRTKTSYPTAREYFQKAFNIAEKYNDILSMYIVSPNIIASYLKEQNFADALQFATRLVNKHQIPDDAMYKIVQNDLFLIIYNRMKDWRNAEKYCSRIVELYKDEGVDIYYARSDVIDYFIGAKKFDKAEESLKIDDDQYKENYIDAEAFILNRQQWFNLDSARGNYMAAIAHMQQYNNVKDSVYNANKSKIVETLRIEHETEEKDKDIQLKAASIQLLTKQTELQKNELQRSRLLRNLVLGGITALAFILGLFYRQFRQKKLANKAISDKNIALQRLLDEKEWLLKEIHHRVKNNLQTVVSLLESQSAYLQDDALLAIQDSQNRVYAMSLIHQKLYQSENVAAINMAHYLPELINYLRDGFDAKYIHFNLQIPSIEIDVSQAIPLGLILNEAITNSIKYAFPSKGQLSNIDISIIKTSNTKLQLAINDNGIGLPQNFSIGKNCGLGIKLMKGLTEDIEGVFDIKSNKGTQISITFVVNTPLNKPAIAMM